MPLIKIQPFRFIGTLPFLWLILFFLLPFLILLKISFASATIGIPPYTNDFHFKNLYILLTDALYIRAFLNSLSMAFWSTLFCLLVAYPLAYAIAQLKSPLREIFLLFTILPSFISLLVRVYAWMGLLNTNGFINQWLLGWGLVEQPIQFLHTNFAFYLGIVYSYLPLMVLPIYVNLTKIDKTLLEAAADLGATPFKQFFAVILPLSVGGIVAGCLLVFIPVIGEFVIPDLLGGSEMLTLGTLLWQEFFNNHDWPMASTIAVMMLLLLVTPIALFCHYEIKGLKNSNE